MRPGEESALSGSGDEATPVVAPGAADGTAADLGEPSAPAPAAPPTQRGTAPRHQRPPMWPTVIGTISIILGASGVLMSLWAIVMMVLLSGPGASLPGAAVTPRIVWLTSISGVLGALVAGVLLVAGVQTCRRRTLGRPAHLTWAMLKIVYAIIAAVLGHFAQQEQLASLAGNPTAGGPNPALASGMMSAMLWAQLLFTALWYSAYPVFILIWFNTRNTKQDCAAWK